MLVCDNFSFGAFVQECWLSMRCVVLLHVFGLACALCFLAVGAPFGSATVPAVSNAPPGITFSFADLLVIWSGLLFGLCTLTACVSGWVGVDGWVCVFVCGCCCWWCLSWWWWIKWTWRGMDDVMCVVFTSVFACCNHPVFTAYCVLHLFGV